MKQVITIQPGGALSGLQHKPGTGISLLSFGRGTVTRASEVLFCTDRQKWYVEFRSAGTYSGKTLKVSMITTARGLPATEASAEQDKIAYFDTYEEGVAAEIDVLNHLRLNETGGLELSLEELEPAA